MKYFIALMFVFQISACFADERTAIKFIAYGDGPYGVPSEVHPKLQKLIENINSANPELVIHVGDLHGHEDCGDAFLDQHREFLNSFSPPVIYTPGDNEWTDCKTADNGYFDPLDRLAYIRNTYFNTGKTLGKNSLPVTNQADDGYPENARLRLNNIGFISVHVVGSNNNFDPNDLEAVKEFMARNDANEKWLLDSLEAFSDTDAIVVALHASMFYPQAGFTEGWGWWKNSPFRKVAFAISRGSQKFGKPVLLLYGDSHEHKVFKPFPEPRPFWHAIEVHGHPDLKAIEISVTPNARKPFKVTRIIEP